MNVKSKTVAASKFAMTKLEVIIALVDLDMFFELIIRAVQVK